jgi:channel protein (hemolysin III family)
MNNDATNPAATPTLQAQPYQQCLPLSMQLLKYVPGMYCAHNGCSSCRGDGATNTTDIQDFLAAAAFSNGPFCTTIGTTAAAAVDARDQDENAQLQSLQNQANSEDSFPAAHEYYDLQSLRRQYTAASPLVVAPMLLHSSSQHSSIFHPTATLSTRFYTERLLHDYYMICSFYKVAPNTSVVTTLRFSLPCLRMIGVFGDADVLALCELLLHHVNGPLAFLHRLDFSLPVGRELRKYFGSSTKSNMGMRSHGALALSKVLQMSRYIRQVYLQRNPIGPYGASALFIACASNVSIQKLNLRRCRVGEQGALVFAEWIGPSEQCGLVDIDLSANFIGFKGSLAIERSLAARAQRLDLSYIHVNLEGNLVLQEITNGITHGLGVLMAFAGSWLLYQAVQDKPSRHFVSCMVYSASLIVLYISSTLFHSFFILQHTKYIFEVLDKCAIYILIAGSYTPFLQIVLWNNALYSVYLLTFIWVCCFLGISVEAFFPTYRYKQYFSLAMYLGMGKSTQLMRYNWALLGDEDASLFS